MEVSVAAVAVEFSVSLGASTAVVELATEAEVATTAVRRFKKNSVPLWGR